jgi:hypothetical protein
MPMRPNPMEEYSLALASERAAWEAVRNRLPGCANYDEALWNRWRRAVEEADRAAAQARTYVTAPPSNGRPRTALPTAVRLPPIFRAHTKQRPPA